MRSHDVIDFLTDPPSGGAFQKWLVGAVLALIVTGHGLWCCITQHATTLNVGTRGFRRLGRGFWRELNGVPAITLGLVIVCIGLFIHFQWYWGNDKRLDTFYEIGKYGAALGLVVAMFAHLYALLAYT